MAQGKKETRMSGVTYRLLGLWHYQLPRINPYTIAFHMNVKWCEHRERSERVEQIAGKKFRAPSFFRETIFGWSSTCFFCFSLLLSSSGEKLCACCILWLFKCDTNNNPANETDRSIEHRKKNISCTEEKEEWMWEQARSSGQEVCYYFVKIKTFKRHTMEWYTGNHIAKTQHNRTIIKE